MPLRRLVFIRPGETDWNLVGRWQGWVAIPLNDLGRVQVQRLANFIRNMGISKLYSSDTRRAVDTAVILAEALGFEPVFDQRLRERSIGHWQGLTVPEIHGWYKEEYYQMLQDPDNYRIPGGESLNDVRQRAEAVLQEIIDQAIASEHETVGIISHTSSIVMMLKYLIPDIQLENVHFGNASVTTVLRDENGVYRTTAINDLSHLEGLEARYMPLDVRGDDR
ncbi:MAG: histidine phosphatase family protein [Phototrophicales bacterium]|nr:MAG: hypothetical protein CUN56_10590 [Phototrophicales bacterium]RMG71720.1 MAG: histidine phosphatase family protein [Chloroflexota bacterium]